MIIDTPKQRHLPLLRQLWKQAFGDSDAFLDDFFAAGFSAHRCRCIIDTDKPVAVLYWFDCAWQDKKLAYIYAVATDAAHRNQGLCRQLMDSTHHHLQTQGYAGAVLVPGTQELFSLYEKMGYRPFCPVARIAVSGQEPAAQLQCVDAETFATLRRQYLPANSVVQEGELLAFLSTFCKFYAGKDFLLCAAKENNTLYFQEYLGDPRHLPGILAALQAEKGIVRLPGKDTFFAMYHSFDKAPQMPDYLGIALD